jgi:hypothetical protein
MLGSIPGMNRGLAATRINEAFQRIQNDNVWSFQNITGGWLTANLLEFHSPSDFPVFPPIHPPFPNGDRFHHRRELEGQFLSPGRITVTPFTNTITGDAVATAAWTQTVPFPPLLTQMQIRVPSYSLYNIIALGNNGTVAYATVLTPGSGQNPGTYTVPVLDPSVGTGGTVSITVNADGTITIPPITLTAGTGYTTPYITFSQGGTPATFSISLIATLTIDRLWTEPPQWNGPYCCYQAYYPVPAGFRRWMDIRDTTNDQQIDWWSMTQADLAEEDPQREIFDQPEVAVPLGPDTRTGSSTYGQLLVELWPHPISQLPYTFQCQCNWPALSLPTDNLPYPLTEELVRQRAYEMCCLWKEGMKGDEMERGSGANWQFLAKAYHEEYKDLLRQIRIVDRNLMELYFTKARMNAPCDGQPDSYTGNQANVGW